MWAKRLLLAVSCLPGPCQYARMHGERRGKVLMNSSRLRWASAHRVDCRDVPSFVNTPIKYPHYNGVHVQHGAPEADRIGRVGYDQLVAKGGE